MMDRESLKAALKSLVVTECDKDVEADSIADGDALIGGPLQLDSLDALQICMAVHQRYGVRIEGNTAARKALASIDALADTIIAGQAA